MEITALTADLGAAAADVARLLPTRSPDPVLAGVLLVATPDGLVLAGTDRERAVRLSCPATVHTEGTVLVPGRPFAETLRALDVPDVRLAVEGSRLALRTPRGRFALPLMDVDLHPGVPEPPALVGTVAGRPLLRALATVAGAASREDALPVFTGVRLRAEGASLRLVATDRYRLAIAQLPWQPAGAEFDVLVPASLLTEIVRQASGATEIALYADHDRAAVGWADSVVGTALLATPFPDEQRYLGITGEATVELAADELTGAVRRAGLYVDVRGAIALQLADGEVRARGEAAEIGEGEESVKAAVHGQLTQTYRVRYLLDALRAFGGQRVRLDIQTGLRATMFTAAGDDPDGLDLRYVVAPILPPNR